MLRQGVYIVDDDAGVRDSVGALLNRRSYATHQFESAAVFLNALGALPVGCILLDMRMRGMNGIEVLKELRRRGRQDPVIFVTAEFNPKIRDAAIKAGASHYLLKPADPHVLIASVGAALASIRTPNVS
jgi:FixJ family two-component response regulator